MNPSAIDAIQNFLNFSFIICSCSSLLRVSEGDKKSGSRAGGGEGEGEKCVGCFETPIFRADVDGIAGAAASGSDSDSDDEDEDEDSEEGSACSATGCGISNFVGFLVSFSDSDSEEDDEEEEEDEKACRLLRFLWRFLCTTGLAAAGMVGGDVDSFFFFSYVIARLSLSLRLGLA